MWTAPWSPYTKAYNEGLITPEKLDTVWTINVDVTRGGQIMILINLMLLMLNGYSGLIIVSHIGI